MIEREGFDLDAAIAMQKACAMELDETFIDRSKKTEFWGLYDPKAVGAVIVHAPWIHVGCLTSGKAAFAVRRIVNKSLEKHGLLLAPIKQPNLKANHLALGLGFSKILSRNGWIVYGRSKWAS